MYMIKYREKKIDDSLKRMGRTRVHGFTCPILVWNEVLPWACEVVNNVRSWHTKNWMQFWGGYWEVYLVKQCGGKWEVQSWKMGLSLNRNTGWEKGQRGCHSVQVEVIVRRGCECHSNYMSHSATLLLSLPCQCLVHSLIAVFQQTHSITCFNFSLTVTLWAHNFFFSRQKH